MNIDEAAVTRQLTLKNNETKTVEMCFDDSSVTSVENFEFMRIGVAYDCKIYLLGRVDDCGKDFKVLKGVIIGTRKLVKIQDVVGNVFYVDRNIMKNMEVKEFIKFKYTRKDVIQVNDIIHPDFK